MFEGLAVNEQTEGLGGPGDGGEEADEGEEVLREFVWGAWSGVYSVEKGVGVVVSGSLGDGFFDG